MTARRYAGARMRPFVAPLLGAAFLLTIAIILGGCGRNGAQPKAGRGEGPAIESARESQINRRVTPPEAGVLTPPVTPSLDIPMGEGIIPATRAVELAAAEVRPMTARGGRLTLRSVRLTTFEAISHGGEYLPPEVPVWHVVFAGDGRLWQPTSGPPVLDPAESYSRAAVIETAEVALNARSGERIYSGVQGGRGGLNRDNLEHYRGRLLSARGNELVLALPDSDAFHARELTVVIPRAAEITREASGAGTGSGVGAGVGGGAVKASFAEVIFSPPGTPLDVWGISFARDAVVASRIVLGTPPTNPTTFNHLPLAMDVVGETVRDGRVTQDVYLSGYPDDRVMQESHIRQVAVQLMRRLAGRRDAVVRLWPDKVVAEKAAQLGWDALSLEEQSRLVGRFVKENNVAEAVHMVSPDHGAVIPLAEPGPVQGWTGEIPGMYINIGDRTYMVRGLKTHQEERAACGRLVSTGLTVTPGSSYGIPVGTRVYLRPGYSFQSEFWVFGRAGECVRFMPMETVGDAGEAPGQAGFAVQRRAGTVVRPSQTMPVPEPLRTRAQEKERLLTMELPVTPEVAKKKALEAVDYEDPVVFEFRRDIWKDRSVYVVSVKPRPCLENPCVPRVDTIVVDGEAGEVLDHQTAW